jgi:hypothetical protein
LERASIIAAIMGSEPAPISSLQPLSPPALERVVQTCLAKDPDERWQTAHDVRLQLEWTSLPGVGKSRLLPIQLVIKQDFVQGGLLTVCP